MDEIPISLIPAFIVGLIHSLEPSHAKAVLASYFLNRKRTLWEAVMFALVVTLAHTLTIFLLALIGYGLGPIFSNSVMEQWGEVIGGAVMMGIGLWMFWTEKQAGFHKSEEGGCCGHSHDFFHHHSHHHDHPQPSSMRQIFVLGFCSGAIPCMSGLGMLTFAWSTASLGRGLLMVTAFSAGLGLVVLVMCVMMQQLAQFMDRYWKSAAQWSRFLPVLSSAIITLMGVWVLGQGLWSGTVK